MERGVQGCSAYDSIFNPWAIVGGIIFFAGILIILPSFSYTFGGSPQVQYDIAKVFAGFILTAIRIIIIYLGQLASIYRVLVELIARESGRVRTLSPPPTAPENGTVGYPASINVSCPKCGRANKIGLKFCAYCGEIPSYKRVVQTRALQPRPLHY